jgi:hypothetical protein
VRATIDRAGGQGIVRVELDPDRKRSAAEAVRVATATIVAPSQQAGSATGRLTLSWVGEDMLEARFPLQKAGLYLGAVQLGDGRVLPLAPLSLPYSPEFEPRVDPQEGQKTLREIAHVTGGIERTAWDDVFRASRLRNRQIRDLVIPLTLALLVLHVVEIAGRRLLWFLKAREWLRSFRLPRVRLRRPRTRPAPAPVGAPAGEPAETPRAAPPVPTVSPLERAKKKAGKRMGR